jgi:uncharacterized protein involved in exopolysaccharide biosynthesis
LPLSRATEIATGNYSVESFSAYDFLDHIQRHWKFIFAVCAAAAILATVVSLILPAEYTATASLVIDPPAGNDPRSSITISPVYLESLRAYEWFASSDTLFEHAVAKFRLREEYPSRSMEAMKRRILTVGKVKDTKVLHITVTLTDPKKAQALAQFLAEQTVELNRSTSLANDQDLLDQARARVMEAQQALTDQQTAWREFSVKQPYDAMRADVEALTGSRERLQRDLTDSRAEFAELQGRGFDERASAVRARIASLEKQDTDLERKITERAAALSDREARGEQWQQRLHVAQASFDAAAARQRDLEGSAGMRTERLRVLDAGVVPEKPSFPNVPLNILLAIGVALIASAAYLTLTFRPGVA